MSCFKLKSTVPSEFQLLDANGNKIDLGTPRSSTS
jgi:hypothetical protein